MAFTICTCTAESTRVVSSTSRLVVSAAAEGITVMAALMTYTRRGWAARL